jgi:hypothetical protein
MASPAVETSQHFAQMGNDDWGTPPEIVNAAHVFFDGPPDLDPASSEERNQVVRACRWLGIEHADPALGIPADWGDAHKLFVNPPGGKFGKHTLATLFWRKAVEQIDAYEGELIWVAYNINQLQTLQVALPENLLRVASVCVPKQRVKYLNGEAVPQAGTPSASAIICLSDRSDSLARFRDAFGALGAVWG